MNGSIARRGTLARKQLVIHQFTDNVADENVRFLDARAGFSLGRTQQKIDLAGHFAPIAARQADG